MFCMLKKYKVYPAYISKHNSYRKKRNKFQMISNEKGREAKSEGRCHYLAVNNLSKLLRGITSKHYVDFY